MEHVECQKKLDKLQSFVDETSNMRYGLKVRFSNYNTRFPPYILEGRNGEKTVSIALDDVNDYGMTKSFGPVNNIVGHLINRLTSA